jgi:hypothetical protein
MTVTDSERPAIIIMITPAVTVPGPEGDPDLLRLTLKLLTKGIAGQRGESNPMGMAIRFIPPTRFSWDHDPSQLEAS